MLVYHCQYNFFDLMSDAYNDYREFSNEEYGNSTLRWAILELNIWGSKVEVDRWRQLQSSNTQNA